MKQKELIKYIESKGFEFVRSTKHLIYRNGTVSISIPNTKEVNKMLSRKILTIVNNLQIGVNGNKVVVKG